MGADPQVIPDAGPHCRCDTSRYGIRVYPSRGDGSGSARCRMSVMEGREGDERQGGGRKAGGDDEGDGVAGSQGDRGELFVVPVTLLP